MLDLTALKDPRFLIMAVTAIISIVTVGLFVFKFFREQKRDKYIKTITSKTEGASKKALSVILDVEARAIRNSGRDEKRPFELINWFAIKRDMKRGGLPQSPPLVFLTALVLSYLFVVFIVAAPVEMYPTPVMVAVLYPPLYFFVRNNMLGMKMEMQRMTKMGQLVSFIESVQRSVSVGTSPDEAVSEAIKETEAPLKGDLVSIKELLDLGYDFVDAINLAADRVNLPEFDIFAASLTAQSTTGGSIGEVLKEVIDIARSRMELTKKISTMTAEGQFNALLLGALPIGLSVYLRYGQPEYAAAIWLKPWGHYIYFAQLGMAIFGAWLAIKISKIKI